MAQTLNSPQPTQDRCLLLLIDQAESGSVLLEPLQNEGYVVQQRYCQQLDCNLLIEMQPELVLFDLTIPSMDSISSCQVIRASFSRPILMLATQGSEALQIFTLEAGVDDFLVKPLPTSLIMAKIRALLRRSDESGRCLTSVVRLGGLVVDAGRREVWSSGEHVKLTTKEFDLLWCLAENARTILSRDDIYQQLYSSEYNGFDRAIDIYISRIRQKIGDDPLNPRFLKTIRGAGYLLIEDHC